MMNESLSRHVSSTYTYHQQPHTLSTPPPRPLFHYTFFIIHVQEKETKEKRGYLNQRGQELR